VFDNSDYNYKEGDLVNVKIIKTTSATLKGEVVLLRNN
jgi:hypothetical protein